MKIFQRLWGTVLFRSATYREIAENANLWLECAPLVIVLALVNSLLYTMFRGLGLESLTLLIAPLISWSLISYLCSFFIKKIYKLDVSFVKIMRVFAYAFAPGYLGVIITTLIRGTGTADRSGVSSTIVLIASGLLIAELVIAVREASQITTGRAIIIFAISAILGTILITIVEGVIGLL